MGGNSNWGVEPCWAAPLGGSCLPCDPKGWGGLGVLGTLPTLSKIAVLQALKPPCTHGPHSLHMLGS